LKRVKTESSLFIHDVHIPYEDKAAVKAALELTEHVKPDNVFLNGDIIDFYSVSDYLKDPERANTLQDDINLTIAFLGELRSKAPGAQIFYILGNHEDRLRRFLLTKASALASLDALKFEELLRLKDNGIILAPRGKTLVYHDLVVTHGNKVASRSGYTAHTMLSSYGTSGQSGHTHRAAKVSKRDLVSTKTWVEGGCLCDLNPDYVDGIADWAHAVTVGNVVDGRVQLDLVNIQNGRLLYDGILFGSSNGSQGEEAPDNQGEAGQAPTD
jgi:predicted phosphodiesterase